LITLQKAGKSNLDLIAQLAAEIWNKHYPDMIGQDQVDYMLGKFYSSDSLGGQMDEGQNFYLVLEDGKTLGYVSMSQKSEGECFLHKFYIHQSNQGKGMGTEVLEKLLALYPSAKNIRLTVNRQNYKSINFYFKNGFIIEKTVDIEIGNGFVMDDFQMLKRV